MISFIYAAKNKNDLNAHPSIILPVLGIVYLGDAERAVYALYKSCVDLRRIVLLDLS